jgi:ribonuclease HI
MSPPPNSEVSAKFAMWLSVLYKFHLFTINTYHIAYQVNARSTFKRRARSWLVEQWRNRQVSELPLAHIYCDGACSPNPGLGGWGAIIIAPEKDNFRMEYSGSERDTTNNRMELTAALMALKKLKTPCRVEVFTDSKYLRNAFEEKWLDRWQKNSWRTAGKKPVQNEDLWRQLLKATETHHVKWNWVRGHADDAENNRADELAVAARVALAAEIQASGSR